VAVSANTDNPAYNNAETAANNTHRARWLTSYNSGAAGASSTGIRWVWEQAGGRSLTDNDALPAVLVYLDADADADIDPYATTATAATGLFGPAGTGVPATLAALREVLPLPVPSTTWTVGQSVDLGDGSEAYWTRVSVPATTGEADTELFTSTAHGLDVGDPVIFTALTGGTGLATDTVYVVATVPDANSFTLATPTGTAVTFSTDVSAATTITGTWTAGAAPA
jgi:hypothetical protein